MLVRPLQTTMLRELSPSLRMEDKVRLSGEIMEVALATTDLDLLFATLFPASGPENKKITPAKKPNSAVFLNISWKHSP